MTRLAALRLLVSVRSVAEARAAMAGGCDILDVKEPARGPMGMAAVRVARAILRASHAGNARLPISLALGEAADWREEPSRADGAPPPRIATGATFLKLGTARCPTPRALTHALRAARERLAASGAAQEILIAVAYADCRSAGACRPEEVARVAAELGFGGLLIDTFDKAGRGLFDCLGLPRLRRLSRAARRAGLLFALAGKIGREQIALARQAGAQVVGIRSAGCMNGLRTAQIDQAAVRSFKSCLVALQRQKSAGAAGLPAG